MYKITFYKLNDTAKKLGAIPFTNKNNDGYDRGKLIIKDKLQGTNFFN